MPVQLFRTILRDSEADDMRTMVLPFVPYPGMFLRAPFSDGDYLPVSSVYWNDEERHFEVFLADDYGEIEAAPWSRNDELLSRILASVNIYVPLSVIGSWDDETARAFEMLAARKYKRDVS